MSDENKNKNLNDEELKLNEELEKELEIDEDKPENNIKEKELPTDEEKPDLIKKESENFVKIQLLKIQNQINQLLAFLDGEEIPTKKEAGLTLNESLSLKKEEEEQGQAVVEGVFTGEEMIGPDGKHYSIPSNYASKSKLVEGDILKLIIKRDGTFVYKQIGPVERRRLIGTLIRNDATDQFYVMVDGERWRILKASVTFFKGEVGDETVILVPIDAKSKWAAVENIVSK